MDEPGLTVPDCTSSGSVGCLVQQPLHRELGAAGSARASLYFYNTERELDVLVDAIKGTVDMFATLDES